MNCRQMSSTIGPCARHQSGECGFADGIAPSVKPLQELPVGEPSDRASLKERLDLPDNRLRSHTRHALGLPRRYLS